MHLKPLLATLALAIAYLSALPAYAQEAIAPSASAPTTGELDGRILQHMQEAGIAGLGAAIIVDRKVVWSQGYGFADIARGVPFTPDTVMNIGSISKTFTGVAMMQAVERGQLSLDADINAYLPFKIVNPHHPDAKITLRQLATHTSGITDRWSIYAQTYHYDDDAPEPLEDFLRSYFVPGGAHYSADNFLDARPGRHQEYSNIGAALAGYIVERATAQPLNRYTREHIFQPLRMDASGWRLTEIDRSRHAKLYVAQDGMTIPIPLYQGTTYPDGGVRTSVADLSKFFIALLDGGAYEGMRILDRRSVDEMQRFQFTPSRKPDNLDLAEENSGLFWSTKFNVTRVGHGGSDPGIKTEMLANLSKDVGVIVFSNTSLAGADMKHYAAIFLDLWKHAEALKLQGSVASRREAR